VKKSIFSVRPICQLEKITPGWVLSDCQCLRIHFLSKRNLSKSAKSIFSHPPAPGFLHESPCPRNFPQCMAIYSVSCASTRGLVAPLKWPLERFRNYCGLIKVTRSSFPWEKTTKGDVAPPDFLRAALTGGIVCGLSSRKAACSSVAPPNSTGNPGSVYINCETTVTRECPNPAISGRPDHISAT
jgi:hypothetical protein